MKNTSQFFVCLLFVLVIYCVPTASARSIPKDGAQQFAVFGDFKLQNGDVIHDFRLGYRTLGTLNADRSNAVLWPTWLGGKSEDLLQFIGTGKVVDPGKYYVVLVDAIGNGVSASPSNSKMQPLLRFPTFTIRDMVESEHRFAIEVLHLSHLYAVMGVSMGGMQTFEWAAAFPDFMDMAIPIAGSPQSTSFDKLLWTAEIDAIELDPAWNHGNPTGPLSRGFALSREIDSMNLTSSADRVAHTNPKDFDAFLMELRKNAKGDGGTAGDHIRQRQAIIALDIPGEFGMTLAQLARRVHAKFLIIISPQDHMVNPTPALEFAAANGAPVITLDSPCGHLSTSCISLGPTVARFLADPASLRSETLHDTANH
jgi:homoserine acetyltransferase